MFIIVMKVMGGYDNTYLGIYDNINEARKIVAILEGDDRSLKIIEIKNSISMENIENYLKRDKVDDREEELSNDDIERLLDNCECGSK